MKVDRARTYCYPSVTPVQAGAPAARNEAPTAPAPPRSQRALVEASLLCRPAAQRT
jgi:hypothetical protein